MTTKANDGRKEKGKMSLNDDFLRDEQPGADYLHVVLKDPDTDEVLDFEIVSMPASAQAVASVFGALRDRHEQRTGDDQPSDDPHGVGDHMTIDDTQVDAWELVAPPAKPQEKTDGAKLTGKRREASEQRRAIERRRHQEMVERLAGISALWPVSPYRAAGERRGDCGSAS